MKGHDLIFEEEHKKLDEINMISILFMLNILDPIPDFGIMRELLSTVRRSRFGCVSMAWSSVLGIYIPEI